MSPSFTAVESGKVIPVLGPDDESVPLASYRQKDTLRILQSPKQIVVVGSTSGTGKSFMFEQLRQMGRADLTYGLDLPDVPRCPILCIDEALACSADAQTIHEQMEALRRQYEKIIIVTGGTRYTPEEQAEILIQRLFPDTPRKDIEIVIRTLQLMNRRQVIDLIKDITTDPFGRLLTVQKPLPSHINPECMADAILPELRLPRIVETTVINMLNKAPMRDFSLMLFSLLEKCYHCADENDPAITKQLDQYQTYIGSLE